MKNKLQVLIIVLIFLSCMLCVNANDLNETDNEIALDTSNQDYESVSFENDSDISQNIQSSQEDIESSSSTSPNDKKQQSYLILDNDADKENIYIGDYVT